MIARLKNDKTVEFVCGNGGARRDIWTMKEGIPEGKYIAILFTERDDVNRNFKKKLKIFK